MCALVTGVQTCALPICTKLAECKLHGADFEGEDLSGVNLGGADLRDTNFAGAELKNEIGRASCRERVCQYVEITVVAVSLKKKSIYTMNRLKKNIQT